MCKTEIWTYRDCGCRYSHNVICRSYRRGGTPCFAPNIQFTRDKWLEGAGFDPELAFRQFKGRTKPTEPRACPQHKTVYESFLNPICEDCLLAEINSLSADGIGPAPPAYPESEAASGEGLVWDSEVKVEIESQAAQDQPVSTTPVSEISSRDSQDIDRTILDSHVEVTIESDGSSVSTGEPMSPLLSAFHTEHSSPPSTAATSPKSTGSCEKRHSGFHNTPDEKHYDSSGDDISSDLGDSDDEGADSCDDQVCQPLPSRGRSLVRGNGSVMTRSVTDPVPLVMPVEKSKSKRGLSTLKTIRSISLNFRPGSKPKTPAPMIEHETSLNEESKLARSRSKNPFRAFRHRKMSQNHVDTMRITPVLTTLEVQSSIEVDQLSFEKPRLRPLPPRKSSMGNLRSFTDPAEAGLGIRRFPGMTRTPVPSPTGSWPQHHLDQSKACDTSLFHLPVHKDLPFDAQSVFSDIEAEETAQSSTEKSPPSSFTLSSTSESAKRHGLETFELGLEASIPSLINQEAQQSAVEQEMDMVQKAVPVAESALLTESTPREQTDIDDLDIEQQPLASGALDHETFPHDQNDVPEEVDAYDEDTEEQSMLDPSEGFELIPLKESHVREEVDLDNVETNEQSLVAPEPNLAAPCVDHAILLQEIEAHDVGTLDSEDVMPEPTNGCEEVDSHDAETKQHPVEDHEPDQEQSVPTIRILDTDQIISLYSYARKPKGKQPETNEEVVLDDVSEITAVSEDDEDSKISDSTTPPSSPPSIEREMSPTESSHPPRKSSLRRLTGFNYSTPLVDPDFPLPSLPSTANIG
ncbi:uncharacterized protein PV06_06128 [Exophiala oligosperma]|uniref:Uncharacterized protein n=1 Tax=Exophiala oligosperma TaxID=215243 RepID=A0A0D2ARU5_9EURO|nr:uncharacterized protein PV06_06128 [Exophiala oligosperma]KIW42596.1 hypothetical protein PV06_06128 [Exophiala oligosperma]